MKRRRFIHALGGLGATALLPSCATPGAARQGWIDTHHHFFSPEYQKAWLDWEAVRKIPSFETQRAWNTSRDLEELDKHNVRAAVLSVSSTPGLWIDGTVATANRLARSQNEFGARMVRDNPGRYALFATLPMLDADSTSTLRELEYALDTLKADGIGLQTSYGDKWPGDASYRPVFQELNRRKSIVYFHPLAPNCCGNLGYGTFPAVVEFPHDTTRAVLSLLLSGSFAQYRDIKWLFSHAGGTVPMLAGRMEYFFKFRKDLAQFAPDGVEGEFRRLHYDTANATHESSMASLLKLVPGSQVTFGSDYPYVPMAEQAASLRELGLSDAEVRAIESGNAVRLIPRLAA
jgi:6-methylsalicylate decarboxylase